MKKLNVGADASVRPLTQKGITLIALIITIIVMLILVGVTINVALNGGLFDKAKTASEQTQRETDKEQLLSAVIGTLNDDGTVNEEELQAHLPDIFKYENGVYKNKVTGKEYTVDSQTGKVTEVAANAGQNTDGNEQQEQEDTSIAGTYNVYMSNMSQLESIVLNDDAEKTGKINNDSITYTYDEDLKKVALSAGIELEFKTVEDNKILFLWDNGMYLIFTTNGGNGITTLNGTFGETPDTFTFSQDGTLIISSEEGEYLYCIIDNYIYFKHKTLGNFYSMENTFGQ